MMRWKDVITSGMVTLLAMYSPFLYFSWAEPAFARDAVEFTPVIPSMIFLIVFEAFGFPIGVFGEVFGAIATQVCFTAVCWALIYRARRRAWYWFNSAVALVFGVSAYSYFALFGLWAI